MEFLTALGKTVLLRSYVFALLTLALAISVSLMGRTRTTIFFLVTWMVAFACEFSSTRTGIPFGWYFYNDSTRGQELYLSNVPFMDSLSFAFLLFGSYCLSLLFLSPTRRQGSQIYIASTALQMSWSVLALSVLFFVIIDVIIDPIALRGDRWFLGKIYYYPEPGAHFGVPIANYLGWALVGLLALGLFRLLERRLGAPPPDANKAGPLLLGAALYFGVVIFNLTMSFWIGEPLIGWTGLMLYLPVSGLLWLKLAERAPLET
jgi:putative membrane protein